MAFKLFDGMWNGATQYQFTVSALCFVSLLYLALNPHPKALVRRICENPVLRHFGKYSFGLYVFHHMFQLVWMQYFGDSLVAQVQRGELPVWAAQTAYQLLAFAGTYVLARLSWQSLEGPFLRMK
jgi:peptidoglycan/LPS O-acetylase OafA/YrhL